jgi:DNA-binding beta-propeller fold protein YncE
MKKFIAVLLASFAPLFLPNVAAAAGSDFSFKKLWTYDHSPNPGQVSEIPAFARKTNTIWVAGIVGVDVLDARTGKLVEHIDTTRFGQLNSVAIREGLAALAIEATTRTSPGVVVFYDTKTRALDGPVSVVPVGALPDMVAFTPDGKKVLVANEATPSAYGARIGSTVPRVFGLAGGDPSGSVSVIDVKRREVIATPTFAGVPVVGANVRTGTGMDFEPEYIAVSKDGKEAYVTLQEANAIAILDLKTHTFKKIVGLGVKDFSLPGNQIDPNDNGAIEFISAPVKGLYMPDGIAAYEWRDETYLVMANEGDFREDDGDRSAAGSAGLNAPPPLDRLRVSNTDSSPGNYFAAGARSLSIRDANGKLVYDSGDILDKKAAELGIYDDGRSRDKGVEPEGVALLEISCRTFAFVGLERTLAGAVAIFDVTVPHKTTFVDMIVTEGDVAPEGLAAYRDRGEFYLAIANEVSNTTTLYRLDPDRKAERECGDKHDDDRHDDDRDRR